ncbi:MAG: hypothetical protein HC924_04085 [Synechococcaceae cyanobacterium SM2_3_2]|nr:hypothetical protein [Synechococcaceae cyanobacterium SM2_3_2]
MLLRSILIFAIIAFCETANGILRVRVLAKRLGLKRARLLSFGLGSLVIMSLAWVFVPWIAPSSIPESIGIGSLWLVLMVAFDLLVGRLAFHYSWPRILRDFDIRLGNLLSFGMALIWVIPTVVFLVRS